MSNSSLACLLSRRYFSVMGRESPDFTSKIFKRITPKYTQKPVGSYPFPPEHEMLWKNRRTLPGQYFQHSISPFQLKFVYPFFHQTPARVWAKLSQNFWWILWPLAMTYLGCELIDRLNRKYLKRTNLF